MFICPNCKTQLTKTLGPTGLFWRCRSCDGRSTAISLLRKTMPENVINGLWQTARSRHLSGKRRCPSCTNRMAEVVVSDGEASQTLDVCTTCQFVWFDRSEYEQLPAPPTKPPPVPADISQTAREKLALMEINNIRERTGKNDRTASAPHEWWQWIPGLIGLPVEQDADPPDRIPRVTWLLASAVTIASIVAFFDLKHVVNEYGLIPALFDRHSGMTFVTSFFIHGGLLHLLANMYFLLMFGDNVEDYLGRSRYIVLLVGSAVIGDMFHIMGDQSSMMPCIGASGGISGVIAFYALTFPHAKIGFLIRFPLFRWVRWPAWGLFVVWLLMQLFGARQQMAGFSNVSALAHLGGAAVGVIFWLLVKKE